MSTTNSKTTSVAENSGKNLYTFWNTLFFLLKGIRSSDPKLLTFMLVEAICTVITPYLGIYLPKMGVDLVTEQADLHKVVFLLGGVTAVMAVSQMAGTMAVRAQTILQERLCSHYRNRLFAKILECDYEHVESAEWQRRYHEATEMSVNWGPWSGTTLMSQGAVKTFAAIFSFCLYGTIIAELNPWLLAMLVGLSLVHYLALRRAQKHEVDRILERSAIQNGMEYVRTRASDVSLGKDLRLYEMAGWIRGYYHHYQEAHFRLRQDVQSHFYHAALVEAVTLVFRDTVAYLYFLWLACEGRITAGDFVLACSAVASFSSLVTQVSDSVGQMFQALPPLKRMRAYLDAADDPEPNPAAQLPAEGTAISIEFRDVSFTYDQKIPVLNHFNLIIQPGEKLALVGVNGAGKTTIVKLLCGFYHPTSGEILLNGTDIRNYRKEDLWHLIAPVFQEATILPFAIAENVSLRPGQETDRERVKECLKTVGLWDKIQTLPSGIDTEMMRLEDEEGIMLSGGQKQKLLMARALYKNAPLLFFDEPTAALDPIAESETYEQFHRLSGDKTAVYISHRLASTRFCDRVVLLEQGQVRASGTHEELLKDCPVYAEMFRVQSQYYRKEEEVVL
ncbi:MAG TPA: ABC transporter ATP-binding protein/permease [Candidatus Blautia stercoravium]|nr:ABC transporter ATP-binding protein/permease [Candidatus Blautia stercoravium]